MPTLQVNARLDADLKRRGDATLAQYGVSATEAIRALWNELATTGTLPNILVDGKRTQAVGQAGETTKDRQGEAARGSALAIRMAYERGLSPSVGDLSFDELREAALEELVTEGRLHV